MNTHAQVAVIRGAGFGVKTESSGATAIYEWLLTVAPVALFRLLERLFVSDHSTAAYYMSAEWGIATVFIVMAMLRMLAVDQKIWVLDRDIDMFLMFLVGLIALVVSVKILTLNSELLLPKIQPKSPVLLWVSLQWVTLALATALYILIRIKIQSMPGRHYYALHMQMNAQRMLSRDGDHEDSI